MRSHMAFTLTFVFVVNLLTATDAKGRDLICDSTYKTYSPSIVSVDRVYASAFHTVGNMTLAITNHGKWAEANVYLPDYITGNIHFFGSEYPRNSWTPYVRYGTFWVGGILNNDTLVSTGTIADRIPIMTGFEFHPDPWVYEAIQTRSSGSPDMPGYAEAISEQDLITSYTDTMPHEEVADYLRGTFHKPLYVEITQKSYAWSNDAIDDFILFDIVVRNIGTETIKDAYLGVLFRPIAGYLLSCG